MIRGPDGPSQLREQKHQNSSPSFMPPPGPKIEVQCTLPGRGRRNGLRAGYRASEGRAEAWAGACGAARLARGSADGGRRYAHAQRGRRPIERGSRQTRRRERAAEAKSTTGLVKDHAQRFLVRIDDVVDEPLARRRMEHQENDRPLRPIMQRHFRRDAVRRHPFSPRRT